MRPPKYYDILYSRMVDGEFTLETEIQPKRMQQAILTLDTSPLTTSGWQRLKAIETVSKARMSQFKKTL